MTTANPTVGNLWQEHGQGHKVFVGAIDKPDLDGRSYRILELKNGLKSVLVNDPLADKSAACLRVAVGSLHDPVHILISPLERSTQ
jgi:secreted Zn-dependent insulinase-like peptidase